MKKEEKEELIKLLEPVFQYFDTKERFFGNQQAETYYREQFKFLYRNAVNSLPNLVAFIEKENKPNKTESK